MLLLANTARADWIFQQSNVNTNISFRAVQAVSAKVVWVGGSGCTCMRTVDGGQTWQRLAHDKLLRMLPDEAAFAASNSSLLLQGKSKVWIGSGGAVRARVFSSADRGQTWRVTDTPMQSGESSGIFGLRFLD